MEFLGDLKGKWSYGNFEGTYTSSRNKDKLVTTVPNTLIIDHIYRFYLRTHSYYTTPLVHSSLLDTTNHFTNYNIITMTHYLPHANKPSGATRILEFLSLLIIVSIAWKQPWYRSLTTYVVDIDIYCDGEF